MFQNFDIQEIKSIIENSKSFGVLLDEKSEEYEYISAIVLEQTIAQKNLPVITLPQDIKHFPDKWSSVIKKETGIKFPQKTSLKLSREKYQIDEVSYKEDGENLSLVLTTENDDLNKDDIMLEKLPPEPEVIFCFFRDESQLKQHQEQLHISENEKIIFINQDEKTITEKVFDITKTLNPNILEKHETLTLLLASLLLETCNYSSITTEGVLSLGSLLLKNNAQYETLSEILEEEKSPAFSQLLGRALARTYIDTSTNTSWSFLNSKDFQKTNNQSDSTFLLCNIVKKLKTLVRKQDLHVLIWQSPKDIKALVTAGLGGNQEKFLNLAQSAEATLQSNFFTIGPFENFSKAEIYIRDKIKTLR